MNRASNRSSLSASPLPRREFLGATFGAALGAAVGGTDALAGAPSVFAKNVDAPPRSPSLPFPETTFSLDGLTARFYSAAIEKPVKILQITDAHLFVDDERGADYIEYSNRMAKAYNQTRHFQTGAETNPTDSFREIVDAAQNQNFDAIVLTGDILSFPSAAGVDFVRETLESTGIPYYYIAGNHDWHYEGLPGTERDQRAEWSLNRLGPLYAPYLRENDAVKPRELNGNRFAYSVDVEGVKLLLVDDSIYEILPEQLEFCRAELAQGVPTALFMHIPFYAPGRSVGFGCGHPNWNASNDGNFKIERRPRWPESGHSETTFAFRREMLAAPNLLGVFAGHMHRATLDICAGKPAFVVPAAYDGSFATLEFLPKPTTLN